MVPTSLRATHFDQFTTTLLDGIEDGVVVYDRELRYQVFNRAMERLTGLRAEDMLGRCPLDVFPHLRAQGIDKLIYRALDGETCVSPETPAWQGRPFGPRFSGQHRAC